MLPKLQIALDNLSFPDAIKALRGAAHEVDIIEVGSVLLCAEGKKAVEYIKTMYPDKIVLADAKIADAGNIIASMLFDAGADWTTVICCAELPTIEGALKVAKKRGKDVQIELTGYWTFEQAESWKKVGVSQVVYHRARDAEAAGTAWRPEDIERVGKLCDMGFQVTVTGGITVEYIQLFKDLPIYVFVAGRSIREAADPSTAARELKTEFAKYW